MNKEIKLQDFFLKFRDALLEKTKEQVAPLYNGSVDNNKLYSEYLTELSRKPFVAQENAVQALMKLLVEKDSRAGILCGDMGTGKTIMAIALAHIFSKLNKNKFLVLAPPHLVFKWKREIENTMPNARVVVLNGSDSVATLNKVRLAQIKPTVPTFYIIGRVRLRLGGDWDTACNKRSIQSVNRSIKIGDKRKDIIAEMQLGSQSIISCPRCGEPQLNKKRDSFLSYMPTNEKISCQKCNEPMWMSISKTSNVPKIQRIIKALCTLPTIGKAKANMIINMVGESLITNSLEGNVSQLVNLLDEKAILRTVF